MKMTPGARKLFDAMTALYPDLALPWTNRAKVIAADAGHGSILKEDLEAAIHLAGDEFLPELPMDPGPAAEACPPGPEGVSASNLAEKEDSRA